MTTSLTSTVVIVCLFLANLVVSNGYFYSRLCQPSTILVRAVFVATFGLSASLLQLCLWEINGSLEREYSPFLMFLTLESGVWRGKWSLELCWQI
jgi:hypothetical protein